MSWSTPRTWAVGEVVTAANMNAYVSADLQYLFNGAASNVLKAAGGSPAGTTNGAGYVMMGLGATFAFTPNKSGVVFATITGVILSDTTGDGAEAVGRYGTGTAPANAAADTGTAFGALQRTTRSGLNDVGESFSLTAIISGLTVNTAYWFDVALKALGGGTASVSAGPHATTFEL